MDYSFPGNYYLYNVLLLIYQGPINTNKKIQEERTIVIKYLMVIFNSIVKIVW